METVNRALFPLAPSGAIVVAAVSAALPIILKHFNNNNNNNSQSLILRGLFFPLTNLPAAQQNIISSLLSSIYGVFIVYIIDRILLKRVLSYTDHITEGRGTKMSTKSRVWGFLMNSGIFANSNETFAYQPYLPALPVPDLKGTIDRWLVSVEPLHFGRETEFATLKKRAAAFASSSEAKKCQQVVLDKAARSDNYVDEWWLQHAYLRDRSSIMINSNYYAFTLDIKPPTKRATSRAAFYLHRFVRMTHEIRNQKVNVQKFPSKVPICMNQYKQILSITRIPGQECDHLKYYEGITESRHIVVIYKGQYYTVPVYGIGAQIGAWKMFPPSHFESVFDEILKMTDKIEKNDNKDAAASETEKNLALLTGWNRTAWAKVREEHFIKNETNAKALAAIESAMMVIAFDYHPEDEQDQKNSSSSSSSSSSSTSFDWTDLNALGHSVCHGGKNAAHNRWYDKSVTMCVSTSNAMIGFNCEHSFADAPCVGHVLDECMAFEIQDKPYEISSGRVSAKLGSHPGTIRLPDGMKEPFERIKFDVSSAALRAAVAEAAKVVGAAANDLDMQITRFTDFGKNKVSREFRLSPDAFVQAAMQLAYYRRHGELCQTYESATTRIYLHGRTETIRSATNEMLAMVQAMDKNVKDGKFVSSSNNSNSGEEKKMIAKLLRAASDRHSQLTALAMTGKGVDRHLFALYIASMGLDNNNTNEATKFLREEVMSRGWKMTSSQVPYGQSSQWKDKDAQDKYRRANGGFGPAHKEGYGVSYAIGGTDRFVVHVTCNKSCEKTDAEKMNAEILRAFKDFELVMTN